MPCPINSLDADRQVNYTSHCLAFKHGYYTWSGANTYCNDSGGWLVEVTDQDMQDFLVSYLSDSEHFQNDQENWWIGAKVSSDFGRVWRWTDCK